MRDLYVEQQLPAAEISDKLDCAKSTVITWLEKHGIEVRNRNSGTYPWQDKDRLVQMYHEDGLDQYEIADELGCKQVTIAKWFKKHGIETYWETVGKLRDEDWLREQYVKNGLSQHQIADKLDCGQMSVSRWCRKHNIETDKANYEKHGSHRFDAGYEVFSSRDEQVAVHRLIMVAEHGVDAVKGMDVHHNNEVKWDNRPQNLELMTPSDHISYHRSTE